MKLIKNTKISEKLTNGKIQDPFAEISKKLCDFAVMHNLQITKLTCSERSFHGGGNSRSRRRARRQSKQAAATDSSSGYESGQTEQLPIEGSTEKEQEKESFLLKQ